MGRSASSETCMSNGYYRVRPETIFGYMHAVFGGVWSILVLGLSTSRRTHLAIIKLILHVCCQWCLLFMCELLFMLLLLGVVRWFGVG